MGNCSIVKFVLSEEQRALCRMNKYLRLFLVINLVLAAYSGEGYSQSLDVENISDRLGRIERDIQVLSRRVYKSEKVPNVSVGGSSLPAPKVEVGSAYVIRLEDRLAEIKGELQSSTNRMEGISHNLDEIKGRLDKLVSDIDFRLTRLENVAGGNGGGQSLVNREPTLSAVPRAAGVKKIGTPTGGPVVSSGKPSILGKISETNLSALKRKTNDASQNGPSANSVLPGIVEQQRMILPKGTPEVQYRYALSILRKTEYSNAELAFSEFIQRHPKDRLTPNARYWLGESFYVRKNYRSAAEAFLRGYQQAPKGVKAPSSLLKLGMSLANMKKKQDACATFSKLAKDYPDASKNIKKHLKREFKRSSCD